jgi:hypothetical protein
MTRGENTRYGTIEDVDGKHIWKVKLDKGSTEKVFKSQQLQIHKEYNKPSETPLQKAASTIKRIVRKTVSKKANTHNSSASSFSSESISDENSSTSTNSDKDEDFMPEVDVLHGGDDKIEVLLTPHPPTPSLGFRSTNKTTDFV